jgi:DNA invertase Pin-like site-specific DNA recombinase
MRFAIYARRSTDDEGESTDSQLKACRELADKRGFTVLDSWIIEEQDVSGRISRDGLDRIIAAAYKRPRPFDALMIWTLSRSARDIGLTLELFESMKANGVQIWRADQGREQPFNTPQDVAMVALESYGAADQPYQTGQAVHRSHRQRAAKGWQVAGREFGYDLVRFCNCGTKNCPERGDDHKGHTERRINKQQAAIVVKIFTLSADGFGDGRIVEKVKGLPSPGEKGWSKEDVKRILRRDIYRGWIVWGRSQRHVIRSEAGKKVYKRSKVEDESQWVREYRPELRIVSDELWDRVRRRKAKTLKLYGNTATLEKADSGVNISTSMLGSIAKCGVCKGSLALFRDRGKAHYRCRTRYRKHTCTNAGGVPAKILEQAVRSAVREALRDPKNIAALEQTLKLQGERWLRERTGAKQDDGRSSLEQEAKKLRLIVERLNDAIERGRSVDKRLEQRTAELAELEAKLNEPPPPKLTRAQIVEKLNAALSPLDEMILEGKARLRMKRDYREAKTMQAQEVRDALRALNVERVIVMPLKGGGWRIEGAANLDRIIAGGSGDVFTIGSSEGSAATIPARYTVSP